MAATSPLRAGAPTVAPPGTKDRRARSPQPALGTEARALLGLIILGAALTIWLWWHNISTLRGIGDWFTSGGRLTGLLGGYGLGILLLLMSRLPRLERRVGVETLAIWHARIGRYVVVLLVAHTLLIIWGYAATTQSSLQSETAALLLHFPDVMAATVGLGLLVGIGILSARAARRRLRYETWFYLHLYAYLAAALAFAHEFSVGADFATHRLARLVWTTFYGLVVAAVLWYRIWTPLRNAVRHRLFVTRVHHDTSSVTTIFIGGKRLGQLRAEPGQFFRWRFLTSDGWWQSHPFSLSARPNESQLRITVKASGDYSKSLQRITVGTRVIAEGPYGALTADNRTKDGVLLLAGGIGITPLRALLDVLPSHAGRVILLYRANQESDVVFRGELDRIREKQGTDIRVLLGPPRSDADVLIGDRLGAEVPDVRERDVFITGPPAFTDAALAALARARVPRQQIHLERFAI